MKMVYIYFSGLTTLKIHLNSWSCSVHLAIDLFSCKSTGLTVARCEKTLNTTTITNS